MVVGRRKLLSLLLVTCAALAAALVYIEVQPRETLQLTLNDAAITVELAQTPQALARGLSNRQQLAANEGMLLDFGARSSAGIWMRHMNFPLDVIWLDEDLKIISITENMAPVSYPNVFFPTEPARYVLEVTSGWVRTHQITVGMKGILAADTATTLY
ncbi:MAG: DUF192 domain-containing protein [Patescibacteria group bacterium]